MADWRVKVAKSVVNLAGLVLTGFAINAGADPLQALGIGALIVTGAESLEYYYQPPKLKPND